MPLAATAALLTVATTLAALVGVRIGRRLRERASESERTQMYGLQASLLGLLALLIGFSFAMAETRYDLRKQLVVDESNAIGTAWLRAGVVGDARAVEIQRLLEAYVAVRLQGYRAHEGGLRAALAESERLQREVWSRATAIARDDPRSQPASLLLQALNAVIDLHATRVAVGRNHIPTMVLATLWLVAVVTLAWVGVCAGMSGRRALAVTLLLSLLVSAVITVIVDLDQPRGGLIRVGQATLADLQRSFR